MAAAVALTGAAAADVVAVPPECQALAKRFAIPDIVSIDRLIAVEDALNWADPRNPSLRRCMTAIAALRARHQIR